MMTLGLSISLKLHLLTMLESSLTIVTCLKYRPVELKIAHQPQSQRSRLILYDPVYERKIFTGLALVFFTSVNIVVFA